ncbi:MAG: patatin-like phospholipase family protein [Minwuia sp.]|uniref:patatin-like phospholipase family protein n=1 Tax=Minwuia sp. TaxID=2493630 RepID=UPI003A8AF9EC
MTPEPPRLGGHPLLDLLQRRRETGSRNDGAQITLAIEGGGMRGVVCGGMVAALESLGLTHAFDEVIGCSAGAIAGAYFIAGQAAFGTRIFYEEINNRRFIDKRRLWLRRPVVSVDFLLDDVCRNAKRLDWQAVLDSETRLVCIAADIDRQQAARLEGFEDREALFAALKASARIPGVAGPPVIIDGRRHVDGGVYENVPIVSARERGASHVVALMTRPRGVIPEGLELAEKLIVIPWLNRQQRGAGDDYRRQPGRYRNELLFVRQAAEAPERTVIAVAAESSAAEVANIETDTARLHQGARDGFAAVYTAFGLEPPDPSGPLHLG